MTRTSVFLPRQSPDLPLPSTIRRLFLILLSRQRRRVFVRALAEPRLHSRCHRNSAFAELLPHTIGRRQRLVPFIVRGSAFQAQLPAFFVEVGRVNSQ